jgi:hypothetical protein
MNIVRTGEEAHVSFSSIQVIIIIIIISGATAQI